LKPQISGCDRFLETDRVTLHDRVLEPDRMGRARWTVRWMPVINAFAITFSDRWPGAESY